MRLLVGALLAAFVGTGCSCQTEGCFFSKDIASVGTVTAKDKTPIGGVLISCDDRDGGLARSNDAGTFAFVTSHMFSSAGCSGDCDLVTFRDPSGEFLPLTMNTSLLDHTDVEVVLKRPDGG